MSNQFLDEFTNVLSWIKENLPEDMLESYDFRKIQDWIIIEKWEDITKLKSVVNMSSIVFDHFKGDLTTLWYSLRFSDPSPTEIENLPIKRQLYLIAHQIVSDLLFVYLHKNGLVFKSQEAELLQHKWFQFLAKGSINFKAQSILKNVIIDSDQIQLSNVFCIKKLTESEKKKLRESLFDRHLFGIQIFSQKIDVILQSKWEKNIRSKNNLNLRDPYNRVLSIFRLIKPEWIDISIFIQYSEISDFGQRGQAEILPISYVHQGYSEYKILEEDEDKFVNDWKYLDSILPEYNQFPLWLTRFLESYNREKTDDAFIDLIITLEAIFNEGGGETTHKICTRIAIFLEKKFEKRVELRKKIRKYYQNRSKIVHGGETGVVDFSQVYELRKIVRSTIMKIIRIFNSLPALKKEEKREFLNKLDFLTNF